MKATPTHSEAEGVEYLDVDRNVLSDANRSKSGFQVDLAETGETVIRARVTAENGTTTGTYTVTVGRADETGPVLESAVVNAAGTEITLTLDEDLSAGGTGFGVQIRVTADGTAVTFSTAQKSGATPETVRLTGLSPVINAGQKVVVAYTDPSSDDDTNPPFRGP